MEKTFFPSSVNSTPSEWRLNRIMPRFSSSRRIFRLNGGWEILSTWAALRIFLSFATVEKANRAARSKFSGDFLSMLKRYRTNSNSAIASLALSLKKRRPYEK